MAISFGISLKYLSTCLFYCNAKGVWFSVIVFTFFQQTILIINPIAFQSFYHLVSVTGSAKEDENTLTSVVNNSNQINNLCYHKNPRMFQQNLRNRHRIFYNKLVDNTKKQTARGRSHAWPFPMIMKPSLYRKQIIIVNETDVNVIKWTTTDICGSQDTF